MSYHGASTYDWFRGRRVVEKAMTRMVLEALESDTDRDSLAVA